MYLEWMNEDMEHDTSFPKSSLKEQHLIGLLRKKRVYLWQRASVHGHYANSC